MKVIDFNTTKPASIKLDPDVYLWLYDEKERLRTVERKGLTFSSIMRMAMHFYQAAVAGAKPLPLHQPANLPVDTIEKLGKIIIDIAKSAKEAEVLIGSLATDAADAVAERVGELEGEFAKAVGVAKKGKPRNRPHPGKQAG